MKTTALKNTSFQNLYFEIHLPPSNVEINPCSKPQLNFTPDTVQRRGLKKLVFSRHFSAELLEDEVCDCIL